VLPINARECGGGGGRLPDRTINLRDQLELYPYQLALAATLCAGRTKVVSNVPVTLPSTHFITCITARYDGILKVYTIFLEKIASWLIECRCCTFVNCMTSDMYDYF
jgi:hypothetical protein